MNILLGHGDSEKFNLLGGAFGDAGDYVTGTAGSGARFFPSGRDKIRQAAYSSYASRSGSSGPGGTNVPRDPTPPRHER